MIYSWNTFPLQRRIPSNIYAMIEILWVYRIYAVNLIDKLNFHVSLNIFLNFAIPSIMSPKWLRLLCHEYSIWFEDAKNKVCVCVCWRRIKKTAFSVSVCVFYIHFTSFEVWLCVMWMSTLSVVYAKIMAHIYTLSYNGWWLQYC